VTSRALVTGLALAGALAPMASACGSGTRGTVDRSPSSAVRAFDATLVGALCESLSLAPSDPGAAGTVFADRAHERLHDLARELEPEDRALTGQLLEAKQAVEADLDAAGIPQDTAELAADLRRLADVTVAGLARLGVPVAGCP